MTLKKACKPVFDQSNLTFKRKSAISLRASILGVAVFSLINFTSNLAVAQQGADSKAPPSLDVEAAKVREKERLTLVESQGQEASSSIKAVSKGAEPIKDSSISLVPVLDVDPEIKSQLDRQFEAIQTLLETEDAFSEKLGENYFSYGKLLLQLARVDEAEEAFINALHIAKVNNGVESVEQRPMLRELFEISYAQRNLKDADSIAKRIVFLERKRPENKDFYAFDIMMRLGHLHMNMFLEDPQYGSEGLALINRAMTFFRYINKRYGEEPLSEVLMPYGEMAFLWYLKYEIKSQMGAAASLGSRHSRYNDYDKSVDIVTPQMARAKGLKYLRDYYDKASEENDIENSVRALLNIGDLNLLYGSQNEARKNYRNAWALTAELPIESKLIQEFDSVVRLPNFKYALINSTELVDKEFDEIPLSLTIDIAGRVERIEHNLDRKQYGSALIRAKRMVKRYKFRPILENGKPLKLSKTEYIVKLPLSWAKKNKKGI